MMTMFAMLLALSALTACAAPIGLTPELNAATMMEEALLSEPAPEHLQYQVELKTYEETIRAEDGAELATSRFVLPVVTVLKEDGSVLLEDGSSPGEQAALEMADAFNAQFISWTEELDFKELAEQAQTDRTFAAEQGFTWAGPYEIELTCELYRTERLISISAVYYSYSGGAHPNTVLLSWNFDLSAGKFFTPEGLAENGQDFSRVVQEEIVRQSQTVAEESGMSPETYFWDNYQEIAANWSNYAVSFDETGMTVGFSPYELASYAAGSQVYHLTYAQLEPYLSEYGRTLLGLDLP